MGMVWHNASLMSATQMPKMRVPGSESCQSLLSPQKKGHVDGP